MLFLKNRGIASIQRELRPHELANENTKVSTSGPYRLPVVVSKTCFEHILDNVSSKYY